jgi:UDP:flavonoid glycosyltransferase YjiC (YdhE family)
VTDLTVEGLSDLINRVRKTPSYLDKARYFRDVIAKTRGLDLAADVIEGAFGIEQDEDSAQAGLRNWRRS